MISCVALDFNTFNFNTYVYLGKYVCALFMGYQGPKVRTKSFKKYLLYQIRHAYEPALYTVAFHIEFMMKYLTILNLHTSTSFLVCGFCAFFSLCQIPQGASTAGSLTGAPPENATQLNSTHAYLNNLKRRHPKCAHEEVNATFSQSLFCPLSFRILYLIATIPRTRHFQSSHFKWSSGEKGRLFFRTAFWSLFFSRWNTVLGNKHTRKNRTETSTSRPLP